MRTVITILLLLVNVVSSHAQDLFVIVYSGRAMLNGKPLSWGFRYHIDNGVVLSSAKDIDAIAFTKDKFCEVKSSVPVSLSTTQIKQNLKPIGAGGFRNYLVNTHTAHHLEEESVGSVVGGVKGLQRDANGQIINEDEIQPYDSCLMITKTVTLKWDVKDNLAGGKLFVIHNQSRDTVFQKAVPAKGTATISLSKDGDYSWYIYSKMENKKRINRVMTKLSDAEINKFNTSLVQFKKDIATLDETMQVLLIDDYFLQNNILQQN